MDLLSIDVNNVASAPSDTIQTDPIRMMIEKYAGMSGSEILSSLLSNLLSFGLKLVGAIVVFFLGRWLLRKFSGFIVHALARHRVDPSVQSFLRSFINITLMLVLVVLVVGIFGINTASFIALFASAGVAVSMALSGSLQNFAGGLMILVFKPYKVGDFIQAQGQSGTVKEIQIFNTVLVTLDNCTIFIPNGSLSNNTIVNYSRNGSRRAEWTFGIAYGDSYEEAKKVLTELLDADPRVLREPAYYIALHSLGESSVNIIVRAWTLSENYWDVYFDFNSVVYKTFRERGIHIPFPQMDVHLVKE
ncbi:MAG: mechanosensitive ion channel [Porphyromonadaceae bacterium]|nr:mechanosensitive ion channel [Porphyromonadaceae bacterium]